MSIQDEPTLRQNPDPKSSSSKSTGTLTGTITNLASGTTYPALAIGFMRTTGTYPRIAMWGGDPENNGGLFEINVHFDTDEPASGTYTVGGPGWKGCSYSQWPSEEYFFPVSGELRLRNYQSVTRLDGELKFDTAVGSNGRHYRIDVEFSVVGW